MKHIDGQMDNITKKKQSNCIKDIGKTNRYVHLNGLLCCERERRQCRFCAGEKTVTDQALLLQSQQKQLELQLALQQERLLQSTPTWGLGSTAGLAEGGLGQLSSGLMGLKHTCPPGSLDA